MRRRWLTVVLAGVALLFAALGAVHAAGGGVQPVPDWGLPAPEGAYPTGQNEGVHPWPEAWASQYTKPASIAISSISPQEDAPHPGGLDAYQQWVIPIVEDTVLWDIHVPVLRYSQAQLRDLPPGGRLHIGVYVHEPTVGGAPCFSDGVEGHRCQVYYGATIDHVAHRPDGRIIETYNMQPYSGPILFFPAGSAIVVTLDGENLYTPVKAGAFLMRMSLVMSERPWG